MKRLIWIVFITILAVPAIAQINREHWADVKISSQKSMTAPDIPTVGYCDLLRNPDLYNEKTIRIHSVFESRFEMAAFYDETCGSFGAYETWVWMNYSKHTYVNTRTEKILSTFRNSGGGELDVVVVGKFQGTTKHGNFGHLNAYRYQFMVDCVEDATLLPKEQDGCSRVDDTDDFYFLSYADMRIEEPTSYKNAHPVEEAVLYTQASGSASASRKAEKIVWLRLSNNSTCPIVIPTASAYRTKLPDGKTTLELQNNARVMVLYNLSSRSRYKNSQDQSVKNAVQSILPPGTSVYFGVPLRYFIKEHFDVRVPFNYSDRKADKVYPLYFGAYHLPESLRQELKTP